jgi:antitoxin component YwqK of YwqJK toxin-antitoxin module
MKSSIKSPVNGPHKELFSGGGLSGEGHLKVGKPHGKWTFYYKSGGVKATGKYLDGELDGHWEWWRENGQPLQAGAFDSGKQVGPWKRYYENGQLWDEGAFGDGKKVGEWKIYEKTGVLKQSKPTSRRNSALQRSCISMRHNKRLQWTLVVESPARSAAATPRRTP